MGQLGQHFYTVIHIFDRSSSAIIFPPHLPPGSSYITTFQLLLKTCWIYVSMLSK